MKLYELESNFDDVRAKYNSITATFANTCLTTKSLYRALSAFRNYTTFINIVGAEYFDTIPDDMVAMSERIEELAQNYKNKE